MHNTGRLVSKDVVYFNSRCGEYNSKINHYKPLKEGKVETYALVIVAVDKRMNGTSCESIIAKAVQSIELTNEQISGAILYDSACNADLLQKLILAEITIKKTRNNAAVGCSKFFCQYH